MEFPVLVCDLAAGTDAIIGTYVLGSVLPHTPYATQWIIRRINPVCRKYRLDCGQNTGGPVSMESIGPGFEFQPGHRRASTILRGGNDSTGFCYPVYYGTT